jgi:hypothetical protein
VRTHPLRVAQFFIGFVEGWQEAEAKPRGFDVLESKTSDPHQSNQVTTMIGCEVCGKPSSVHLTEVDVDSAVKREHHYCWEHSPPELGAARPSPADEVKAIEQMIAQLDANQMDHAEKAKSRAELQQLAKDIRSGRRRLSDAD